jgi:hypothetical protein
MGSQNYTGMLVNRKREGERMDAEMDLQVEPENGG